jgi:hypothetical protein
MEKINTERLKVGDKIMTYDSNKSKWVKCKVCRIGTYVVILKGIIWKFKNFKWIESLERLKDPDYYRQLTITEKNYGNNQT